ncbi:MAG: 30S ribosomal protein S1 [Clostridia bacterium]|nr:30S ribosomal protein S1 [Clostridia bacterium]
MTDNRFLPEGSLIGTPENTFYTAGTRGLLRAKEAGATLEAQVLECSPRDMALVVDLGGVRGIIPRAEAGLGEGGEPVRDIAVVTRVSRAACFKVLSVSDGRAILSRRAAQEECRREYVSRLRPGDVIRAAVTHLEPFGAFVDIGRGIVSLLTVDTISVSRISHPSDRFNVGGRISAVVKSVDGTTGRVFLTHRELLGTWEENAALITPSATVRGIVRSVEDYGVFVELAPNLAGLAEYRDGVYPGDRCAVFIKSVIPEKMKIKLVMVDCGGTAERMPLRYFLTAENTERIDRWRYSPAVCPRVVESVFA